MGARAEIVNMIRYKLFLCYRLIFLKKTSTMQDNNKYLNISGYCFHPLSNREEIKSHFLNHPLSSELRGTILLAPEGINLFLSGLSEHVNTFLRDLCQHINLDIAALQIKESYSDEHSFNRFLIRLKKEIIAFDTDFKSEETAPYVEPQELEHWLDTQSDNIVMVDTRNDYEIELGTFKNAFAPQIKSFKEFKNVANDLGNFQDKILVTFCTGGIRCEKATMYLKKMGLKNVYQLKGGILRYFEETPAKHYDGECFVFDRRVSLKPNLETSDKKVCFACRHPLTPEDYNHPLYTPGESCPYCAGPSQ